MSLKDRILGKSGSYNYYKDNYDRLKKQLKTKNSKIKDYEALIHSFETRFDKSDGLKKDAKDINIAYVLYAFPIHSQTFVVNEVRWLVENGYNVVIFTKADSDKPVELDFAVENYRFSNTTQLEALFLEHDIDIAHTHFIYPMCTNFTYPVCERLKVPFTVFVHAYDIFRKDNDERNKIDEISNSECCRAIFTLSEFHKNYLLERNVREDKIVITKQATSYELAPLTRKDRKIKNIISISRFVEKKGLDVLIDAAKLLEDEDFTFEIYGFGDLHNQLQSQIDELGCRNISIKGELQPNEVQDKLMEADLLAAPCKIAKNGDMDGFPTVIFEAMACGLPYVTTKVSAIPEIVEDGVNGFITEPESPELFAQKIIEVSRLSSDELFEVIRKAQEDVENISSVEKTMNRFIDTIKE